MRTLKVVAACAVLAAIGLLAAAQGESFALLKSVVWPGKQASGGYLVPTSQMLHPWGEPRIIAGRPVDLAINGDGSLAAVLNGRTVLFARPSTGVELGQVRTKTTSYAGIAFRPGTNEVWASEATRSDPDSLFIARVDGAGKVLSEGRLQLKDHAVPAGIAFSPDGRKA